MKSPKLLHLAIAAATVAFSGGCATQPRGFPPREGISNLDRVNDGLYRGAQPNGLGIEGLKRLGIKTIVNLRTTDDTWVEEERVARKNGIAYTHVPMKGLGRPTDEQVSKALKIIATFPSPVFVHCQHGCDRTGTIIACYRIQHDGWTSEQALSEAVQYGMSWTELGMKDYVVSFAKTHKTK